MVNSIERAKKEEGFSGSMYKCPAGYLTIGYGINLEATPIPEHIAELWLAHELNRVESHLMCLDWFIVLDENRRHAIIDMAYNMGVAGVCKFKSMISALRKKDYETAAKELVDSKYFRDVPNRARRNRDILLTGCTEVL